ncbi:putative bifunctional diguanylate cyclase/phosphodiesterase [Methyloradius palustris]|uniref:Diguanylate cyclase/phosphodiesterase with PAS/PAC sensor(S) n=1 Tax=Methyloradius palustris TaxID=2778876 RepID=A0A8D5G377_9PROT|nr:EAL domain-containing protein [Methyloradius palustris]BCM24900.1 hypothetical protein ZMTM_11590 [Methyloradius palustris]
MLADNNNQKNGLAEYGLLAAAKDSATINNAELTAEIVKNLYSSNLKTAFVNMLFVQLILACILINFESQVVDQKSIVIASTAIFATYIGRYLLAIAYHTTAARNEITDYTPWLKRYRIAATSCGISWGIIGLLLFAPHDIAHQTFLVMSIAGVIAGASVSFAYDDVTLRRFVYSIILLTVPNFLLAKGISFQMGALLMLFLLYVSVSGSRLTRMIGDNIRLKIVADKSRESIAALAQKQKLHLEQTPMGVIEFDTEFRFTSWNPAAEKIFGYSAAEAIHQHAKLIIPNVAIEQVNEVMNSLISDSGGERSRNLNIRKDGTLIECEWFNTTLRDSQNNPIGIASIVQDITDHVKAQEEIQRLAFFDALTNLPNRRLMTDRLNQALVSSKRTGAYGAAMFIDLDDFKTLNDTKGHGVGDLLLQEVSGRLQNALRENDSVARIGGDEFVIMIEDLSDDYQKAVEASHNIAHKLIKCVNQPFNLGQYNHYNSCSLGVTLFRGQDVTVDDILQQADTAMYEAKKAGRNNFKFFNTSIKPELDLRASLKNDLFVALEKNQLMLFFQAQVNHNYQIKGAEILLRWQHPEHGMVSPAEFIPIAESSGLIIQIGNWVLRQACQQLKEWEQFPIQSELKLSVNVSALQFSEPGFTKQVETAIKESGCNPKLLVLELTESLVLQNIDDIVSKMQRLKQIGVSLSLDDFGVGYSSLSVLKRLPLDELKIDRSFVLDALERHDNAVIVETIIAMGKSLELEVIAEGVETIEQLRFLQQIGCRAYQGYMFCKPMDIATFENKLSDHSIADWLMQETSLG